MGGWIEADWARSSERYEELSFGGSTEQSLFLLARALEPTRRHIATVQQRSEKIYGEAVDRGLFAVPREDVVRISPNLYPFHPAAVAAIVSAQRRFGQNERSLFSFLLSLEPASFKRFAHSTLYDAVNWYMLPLVLDYLTATISLGPGVDRLRRWSLVYDVLAVAADLPSNHLDVLKTVALVAVLEPLPGLVTDAGTIAWSLGEDLSQVQQVLDDLANRNLLYRRPHRGDYSLWSSSCVDLTRWLDEASVKVPAIERIEDISPFLTPSRPAVAHRHYHATGTLRTFEVLLWTGKKSIGKRSTDGLILVAPVYPGENREKVLSDAAVAVEEDPMALVCARTVALGDIKWANELALWNWIRDNCEELKLDELARAEVYDHISTSEKAMTHVNALLSSLSSGREETWWFAGEPVVMPTEGLSALLSNICDSVYSSSPILKNELINRVKLSSAAASARKRLMNQMLTSVNQAHLGMEGAPPERTIYMSLFQASGIHREDAHGLFSFGRPGPEDPCRWRPIWDRIAELLESGEAISFAVLMEDLAAPPYGLRAGPALLVIVVFVIASRDNIAIMERNSFQPELTGAHFMRLAKSPGNFAVKSLLEGASQIGVLQALSTRLRAVGICQQTVVGIAEQLFMWYNSLPPHASKTNSLSPVTVEVRGALRKASEPGRLFFHELPLACGAIREEGLVDVEHFVESLDKALVELGEATPKLRMRAAVVAQHAFGVSSLGELRSQIQKDYEPYRLKLYDYRLRAFVERALNKDVSDDRWLDGIAGHLTGQRPDNWEDGMFEKFAFEIREVAEILLKWLIIVGAGETQNADLRSVHVVGVDGREKVVVVRLDRPNPLLESRLSAVREVLGNVPETMEVLGQLLAEYADKHSVQFEEKEEVRT